MTETRRLAADLRLQFNKAADDSNRAVMAGTEQASSDFAKDAAQLKELVKADVQALAPRLERLRYVRELNALQDFERAFAEYERVDRVILDLAVENTNLKAQRLAYGPAREAADSFRDALATLAAATPGRDRCGVDSLVAKAVIAVREIQVLQPPHIAEADDAVMARLEKQMGALDATAQEALAALSKQGNATAQRSAATAREALDRFRTISAQLLPLSRRNSNVRSLALSLGQKPPLATKCEYSLRALQETLDKESFAATR